MTTSSGRPRTPPKRPPLRRGAKEAIVAVAALPFLLAVGLNIGGHLGTDSSTSVPAADRVAASAQPPPPSASPLPTRHPAPAPLVTVKPAAPAPLVTVKPAAPAPLVTVKPAAPAPLVTVRPAPSAGRTALPAAVVTVKPAPPGPVAAARPASPSTSPRLPFPPVTPARIGPVASAPVPAAPRMVLGRGSTGADVRAWQRQMARRTWHIAVDGIFGPQSAGVARQFQREKGLPVDGLVGPQTWTATWRLPVTR